MSTKNWMYAVALLGFALSASANAEAIDSFLGAPGGTSRTDAFNAGLGFYANPSGTAQIDRLGYYDAGGDGLSVSHDVALLGFNGVDYTVLAKVTVQAGTASPLVDGYRWESISELTLSNTSSGADYYLLLASNGTDAWTDWDGITGDATFGTPTDHGPLLFGSIPSVGGTTALVDPTGWMNTDNSYGGANMGLAVPEVPEPSTLVLLAAGMIGLLCYAWRKR